MGTVLAYLKEYKREGILAPFFKMLEASFELFIPLVVARIIDVGIANGDRGYVVKMCLVMVMLGVIGLACSITAQYYAARAAVCMSVKLRHALYEYVQGLTFARMDDVGSSTLITRLTSDVNQVQTGVNLVLRLFLRSPFVVFGSAIMSLTISRRMAIVFLLVIMLLSLSVFGIMLLSMPLNKRVQTNLEGLLRHVRENLSGVRVIRAFCKEEEELSTFKKKNDVFIKMQTRVGRISSLMNPVTFVIVNAGIIVLIYMGALAVGDGALTRGEVVALVGYMSQILVELVKLASLIITISKSLACAKRIGEILKDASGLEIDGTLGNSSRHESKEMPGDNSLCKYEIDRIESLSFENVSFTYQGSPVETLTNISFDVKRGQTVGIVGSTGSGKSTLMHLIPRLYDVDDGRILLNGHVIKDYDLKNLRGKIGIVMQNAALFTGTIEGNIKMGKGDASEEDVDRAVFISQSAEFVEKKGDGTRSLVEQGGRNLSGGQRQRLSIARALVREPEILILDDSSSALDYITEARLRKEIKRHFRDKMVFVVSQRASSVIHADIIIVMEEGGIVGMGRHEELTDSCDVYREICCCSDYVEMGAVNKPIQE